MYIHVSVNIILAVIAYLLFGIDVKLLVFFVAMTAIIDFDHPWPMAIREKTLSPSKIYNKHQKLYGKCKHDFYIFHSPEINVILAVLSFFNPYFLAAFISNAIHIGMDACQTKRKNGNIKELRKWSIIYQTTK